MPQVGEPSTVPAVSASIRTSSSLRTSYLLAFFTLVGLLFRLLYLGRSLWADEPATVAIARLPWPRFMHLWWYGEAAYQGTYFLLMRGWLRLGQSEAWIRLPSVLFAVASILLIYSLARKLAGDRVALLSAALMAFSPTDVYYAQEARSYTMAILLVMAATWFFVRAVETNRESDWIGWTAFGALAVYTHLFACLVLVAHACALLAWRGPQRRLRALVHGALILAMTAPALTLVLRLPSHLLEFDWMPRATPKQLLHMAMFLGGSGEKVLLSAILWVAAVRTIWRNRGAEEGAENLWHGSVLISWAVVPVVIDALISLHHPIFVQRYMIFSLPATIMLAAWGAIALPTRRLGLWLVLAWCFSSVINIYLGYQKAREDWRGATRAVLASAQSGDAVLVYPSYASPGFDFYYEVLGQGMPTLRVFGEFYGSRETDEALYRTLSSDPGALRQVWVLLRDQGPGRRELSDYSPPMAAKLQRLFGEPQASTYNGILLLKFGQRGKS